jgi:hypothetical protein
MDFSLARAAWSRPPHRPENYTRSEAICKQPDAAGKRPTQGDRSVDNLQGGAGIGSINSRQKSAVIVAKVSLQTSKEDSQYLQYGS